MTTNHNAIAGFGLPDVERLSNGVRMLRCGRERDAIRAPYDLGVTAYAILRWQGGPIGDVLAHRRRHVYFLVPAGVRDVWDGLRAAAGCLGIPLRLISEDGMVMLPLVTGRFVRWLHGPGFGPACPAADVLAALRTADERLIARGIQRVTDQETAALVARLSRALGQRDPAKPTR